MENFFLRRRKELEKKAGERISQHDLAIKLGVTSNTIGQWERGDCVPRLSLAPKLAAAYEVPFERIEQEIVKLARLATAST